MTNAYTEDQLVERPAIRLAETNTVEIAREGTASREQIQNLRRTRDLLLPRLLSGLVGLTTD